MKKVQTTDTSLYRRTETARRLACSESQVLKFERAGLLTTVRLPGLRAVRNVATEVDALAAKWIAQAQQTENASSR